VTGDLPGTSGGGAVIYPPPPISTPLSSNGGGREQHRHATYGPSVYRHHWPVMSTMTLVRPVRPVMYLVIPVIKHIDTWRAE